MRRRGRKFLRSVCSSCWRWVDTSNGLVEGDADKFGKPVVRVDSFHLTCECPPVAWRLDAEDVNMYVY